MLLISPPPFGCADQPRSAASRRTHLAWAEPALIPHAATLQFTLPLTVSDPRLLHDSLTAHERDVLALVTPGMMNRLIAEELGVSEITVKGHRSHLMRKMPTSSLAGLARIADTLGVRTNKSKGI